jgi:hypothetical protein
MGDASAAAAALVAANGSITAGRAPRYDQQPPQHAQQHAPLPPRQQPVPSAAAAGAAHLAPAACYKHLGPTSHSHALPPAASAAAAAVSGEHRISVDGGSDGGAGDAAGDDVLRPRRSSSSSGSDMLGAITALLSDLYRLSFSSSSGGAPSGGGSASSAAASAAAAQAHQPLLAANAVCSLPL